MTSTLPSRTSVRSLLQGRTFERVAGEPAIVIAIWQQAPAFMGLALHIGLAGFPLGIERVECKIEVMLGRFAGVDRAELWFWCLHGCTCLDDEELRRGRPGSAAVRSVVLPD